MKTLLIAGATGLVGRAVLRLALAEPAIARVVVPTRWALEMRHEKLVNPVVDFEALPVGAEWWRVDAVVCTLGTTIKKAGSQAAFRQVDHDHPLAVARLARAAGAQAYALTSSMGANVKSPTFYLRTKGETERDLAAVGLPSVTVVRPSLIGGERAERRWGEALGLQLFKALGPVLPRRYRIVPAERIAARLLASAISARLGLQIVESEAI
ncbi:MAG: NAD-dependent dehydratase [Opitutia bacterium]|nr:NAD-dependent dehydratase [Opitutaceae bacterium]PHX87078.1 MAG: NAD-dependent dehydratase [Opitutae bacterium]